MDLRDQRVEDSDAVAAAQQLVADEAADESGAASDQNSFAQAMSPDTHAGSVRRKSLLFCGRYAHTSRLMLHVHLGSSRDPSVKRCGGVNVAAVAR
jgi:hypothetical protein